MERVLGMPAGMRPGIGQKRLTPNPARLAVLGKGAWTLDRILGLKDAAHDLLRLQAQRGLVVILQR